MDTIKRNCPITYFDTQQIFSTVEEELAALSAARSELASEVFSTGMNMGMRSYNSFNNIENLNV